MIESHPRRYAPTPYYLPNSTGKFMPDPENKNRQFYCCLPEYLKLNDAQKQILKTAYKKIAVEREYAFNPDYRNLPEFVNAHPEYNDAYRLVYDGLPLTPQQIAEQNRRMDLELCVTAALLSVGVVACVPAGAFFGVSTGILAYVGIFSASLGGLFSTELGFQAKKWWDDTAHRCLELKNTPEYSRWVEDSMPEMRSVEILDEICKNDLFLTKYLCPLTKKLPILPISVNEDFQPYDFKSSLKALQEGKFPGISTEKPSLRFNGDAAISIAYRLKCLYYEISRQRDVLISWRLAIPRCDRINSNDPAYNRHAFAFRTAIDIMFSERILTVDDLGTAGKQLKSLNHVLKKIKHMKMYFQDLAVLSGHLTDSDRVLHSIPVYGYWELDKGRFVDTTGKFNQYIMRSSGLDLDENPSIPGLLNIPTFEKNAKQKAIDVHSLAFNQFSLFSDFAEKLNA